MGSNENGGNQQKYGMTQMVCRVVPQIRFPTLFMGSVPFTLKGDHSYGVLRRRTHSI